MYSRHAHFHVYRRRGSDRGLRCCRVDTVMLRGSTATRLEPTYDAKQKFARLSRFLILDQLIGGEDDGTLRRHPPAIGEMQAGAYAGSFPPVITKEQNMIGYVTLGTNDLPRAAAFYDALLAELGGKRVMEFERGILWGTGPNAASLGVLKPFDGQPAAPGNGPMVALAADSRATVDRV